MTQWSSDPRTVNEVAFDRLRELILTGQLEMGERLDERSLAERIDVSRTPLREAISRLARLGVVEQRVYRGAYLRVFTSTQVTELYELRKVLEGLAARKAAAVISPAQLVELERIIHRGTEAFHANDTEGFETADQAFHSLIVSVARSELLTEHLNALELRIQLVRHLVNLKHDVAAHTVDDRDRVLKALIAGDAAAAESAMIEHISAVESEALRSLTSEESVSTH